MRLTGEAAARMKSAGRRAADPPFPKTVTLLGRRLPLWAERSMPHAARRLALAAILRAVRKLAGEGAAGRLSGSDRRCLGALRAFAIGRGRSGQDQGVFIFGLADVRATADPAYWSSALVHDGMHALLQRRGRPYRDEVAPCEAQIDYLLRTGGSHALVDHLRRFRDSQGLQRRRLREPV